MSTTRPVNRLNEPPVLAGSYAGVRGVDGRVVDAARGIGMTSAQRLWQVELPGVPSGLRLAAGAAPRRIGG